MTANEMRDLLMLKFDGAQLANRTFNDREISDFLTRGAYALVKTRYDKFKNRTQRGYPTGIRSDELAGLVTGTTQITSDQMIHGSEINGALLKPDLDNTTAIDGTFDSDKFGDFVAIPNEAMYITNETVNTMDHDETNLYANIPIIEVSYDQYSDLIYNSYRKPYKNLVWSMDWGAFTVASIDGTSSTGMTGDSYDGTSNSINSLRARYLLPGKSYKIHSYRVFYIKTPSNIVVDVQDPSAQQSSDLAEFLHEDIVEEAVKIAAASVIPEQNKYQVSQNETAKDE